MNTAVRIASLAKPNLDKRGLNGRWAELEHELWVDPFGLWSELTRRAGPGAALELTFRPVHFSSYQS